MSDAKHTPGPWHVKHDGLANVNIEDAKGRLVADTCPERPITDEEAEANARLVAAAPELLEAAADVMEWFNDDGEMEEIPDKAGYYEWVNLRTAIAKARGQGGGA